MARKLTFLLILNLTIFLVTSAHKHPQHVWTLSLRSCHLDYHTNIHAFALACPGLDHIRLWPLPLEGPWQSTPDPLPDPFPGSYAAAQGPARHGGFFFYPGRGIISPKSKSPCHQHGLYLTAGCIGRQRQGA